MSHVMPSSIFLLVHLMSAYVCSELIGSNNLYNPHKDGMFTEKKELLTILNRRNEVVVFFRKCSGNLLQQRWTQFANEMARMFETFKQELESLKSKDKAIVEKLLKKVFGDEGQKRQQQKKPILPNLFTEYGKLINFLKKNLRRNVSNKEQLNTPFWKRMTKFFTDPFAFIGHQIQTAESEKKVVEKNKRTLKHHIEEKLHKNRRLLSHLQYCMMYAEQQNQQNLTMILSQSATNFRKAIEKINDQKSKKHIDHIKRDVWSQPKTVSNLDDAFRNYAFIYNLFDNHLTYFDNYDYHTEYWKKVIEYLEEPSSFLRLCPPDRLNTYGFGGADSGNVPKKVCTEDYFDCNNFYYDDDEVDADDDDEDDYNEVE